jgi:hypothetical protein
MCSKHLLEASQAGFTAGLWLPSHLVGALGAGERPKKKVGG